MSARAVAGLLILATALVVIATVIIISFVRGRTADAATAGGVLAVLLGAALSWLRSE